jgi:hypothetical protein
LRIYKYSVGFRNLLLIAAYSLWVIYNTHGTTLILYVCMMYVFIVYIYYMYV